MSEREVERRGDEGRGPARGPGGHPERRGGGASLDAGVRERLAPALGDPLTDVRIHTDTGAGTLARAVSARAFATGRTSSSRRASTSPGPPTATGCSRTSWRTWSSSVARRPRASCAYPSPAIRGSWRPTRWPGPPWRRARLRRSRERPARRSSRATSSTTSRVLGGRQAGGQARRAQGGRGHQAGLRAGDQPRHVPLVAAEQMLMGDADVAKARSAIGKVIPAAEALMVIAGTKKEAKNRDNLYKPVDETRARAGHAAGHG